MNLKSSLLLSKFSSFFIGGGSAGCNLLYQLSKRGVDAVLLERGKLTSGTTWHTGRNFLNFKQF